MLLLFINCFHFAFFPIFFPYPSLTYILYFSFPTYICVREREIAWVHSMPVYVLMNGFGLALESLVCFGFFNIFNKLYHQSQKFPDFVSYVVRGL